MKKFFILFGIPVADIDEWMKKPEAERKGMEQDLMQQWNAWMTAHEAMFVNKGGPLGKNKRATGKGVADVRNDLNWYAIVQGASHDEVANMFADHPQVIAIPSAYIQIMEMPERGM